MQIKEY